MNKELEQAKALREEAREALALARETNEESKLRQQEVNEMLDETRAMQKSMLLSHSRISYALASLLPKQVCDNLVMLNGSVIGFIDSGYAAESMAGMSEKVSNAFHNRDVFDIVNAINVLAMANTDVLHVFVSFLGHVSKLDIYANAASARYIWGEEDIPVFSQSVCLGKDNALEKLLAIESQLTELIIEAREAAETKAPEQAEVKA
ncbi:hypothetical protein M2H39_08205 [Vibrio vulnificus]|nr:hypothetical protein [Vibrio vulnificus]MCU8109180.1 hypothetical protein [Vibrio vulnificus]